MSHPQERANAIRFLSMDAVQLAQSGHPGMPMGMADIAEVLFLRILKHNPLNPHWVNRDRFILSNGHGSMLLYSALHLCGYDLCIEDLKKFRQLHSKTPGHPELHETPGVETTTGPLGQGLANAVGMAIAEKHLAAQFNRPDFPVVDHHTYVFVGDGCLMEGISHEVSSLAGTLALNKLIVIYDDNRISIDGDTTGWFTDNTPMRFRAYGFKVIENVNGHDPASVEAALEEARSSQDQPVFIQCKTTIGFGAPQLSGTAHAHGSPLGAEEIARCREQLNWSHPPFFIPDHLYKEWNQHEHGQQREHAWQTLFNAYQEAHPALAAEFVRRTATILPHNWQEALQALEQLARDTVKPIATRKASQSCLTALIPYLPELMGGSADLSESNCTFWKDAKTFNKHHPEGSYLHYGVREFGMSAILNGLALHGGVRPFGGTFLTFSDYARNAVRLSAYMRAKVIYIYSHDSIGLGEDGPTHQPIEHLPSLRLIPHLHVWRPADMQETTVAWQMAIEHSGASCLLLSRQNLPVLPVTDRSRIQRGGYIVADHSEAEAILIATGSEVGLCLEAKELLQAEGIHVRLVSMPCVEVFLSAPHTYQETVFPSSIPVRLAVEAAHSRGSFQAFLTPHSDFLGVDQYGASAPAADVYRHVGLTKERIQERIKSLIKHHQQVHRVSHESH